MKQTNYTKKKLRKKNRSYMLYIIKTRLKRRKNGENISKIV